MFTQRTYKIYYVTSAHLPMTRIYSILWRVTTFTAGNYWRKSS